MDFTHNNKAPDCICQVVEHILCFLGDPVTVVRAENVSQLWRSLIQDLVRKGKLKKRKRTLTRLKTTESFNESFSIKEAKVHAFKVTSPPIFLQHKPVPA